MRLCRPVWPFDYIIVVHVGRMEGLTLVAGDEDLQNDVNWRAITLVGRNEPISSREAYHTCFATERKCLLQVPESFLGAGN